MKMAAAVDEFSIWLGNKLKELNTDENIFGSYITGILDGDESVEDKIEAIEGILSEIIENGISAFSREILEMWQKFHPPNDGEHELNQDEVDEKLLRLLESQKLETTVQRNYTEEERKIREAILAQYSEMTDEECDVDDVASGDTRENGLEKNTNALTVHLAEREKREQAKMDSQKKKEKDKEDREKQKQQKEEKKEKRKTQKGERKR